MITEFVKQIQSFAYGVVHDAPVRLLSMMLG